MPKFLIINKRGFLTTATRLVDRDYKRANNGEIQIILMSEQPEQYVRESWSKINRYSRQ